MVNFYIIFPIDVYGKNKAIKMIEYMHQSNPREDKTVITKPTLIRKGLLLVWSPSTVSIAMVGQEEKAGTSITRLMDWLFNSIQCASKYCFYRCHAQAQHYHKVSTAVAYACRFPEPTRHFDKYPDTFCSGKENICLASLAVEQRFHILFTSSQEVRQFLQTEKRE